MSCIGPFPMAELLRNVITGCVELLRGFCDTKGTSEIAVSNVYIVPSCLLVNPSKYLLRLAITRNYLICI